MTGQLPCYQNSKPTDQKAETWRPERECRRRAGPSTAPAKCIGPQCIGQCLGSSVRGDMTSMATTESTYLPGSSHDGVVPVPEPAPPIPDVPQPTAPTPDIPPPPAPPVPPTPPPTSIPPIQTDNGDVVSPGVESADPRARTDQAANPQQNHTTPNGDHTNPISEDETEAPSQPAPNQPELADPDAPGNWIVDPSTPPVEPNEPA